MNDKQMVAEIIRRNEIMNVAVTVLVAAFFVLAIVLTVREHMAKMRAIREHRQDVMEWQGVQIARGDVEESCGKTWYRMN